MPRAVTCLEERYAAWKEQQGLPADQQVFRISVPLQKLRPEALIRALLERGWVENKDPDGQDFFDFWWSIRREEVCWENLRPWQIINHMQHIEEVTRKIRLYRHLRDTSCWLRSVDVDTYLPRSYDLSDLAEAEEFAHDFKVTYAESLVRRVAAQPSMVNISTAKLRIAIQVVSRKIATLSGNDFALSHDLRTQENVDIFDGQLISPLEWNILLGQSPGSGRSFGRRVSAAALASRRQSTQAASEVDTALTPDLVAEAQQRISELAHLAATSHPQLNLNGQRNLWVLKPGELSRGRGVMVMDSLVEISRFFGGWFTVQKYQENPLLIARESQPPTKHDLRQHVLVQSWDPLRVWIASEFYVRFASQPYDLADNQSPGVHITNTCVGKKLTGQGGASLQWSTPQYADYLKDQFGADVVTSRIIPQIREIVKTSIACLQEAVKQDHLGKAYELIGYDFAVSDDFKVWLIEANEMPALDYDSEATERTIGRALNDTVRVLLEEPCPADGEFLVPLMNEAAIEPVPPLCADLSVLGVGYRLAAEGATLLRSSSGPVRRLDKNLSIKDFLDKIENRKAKEASRKEARMKRMESCTRLVLSRIGQSGNQKRSSSLGAHHGRINDHQEGQTGDAATPTRRAIASQDDIVENATSDNDMYRIDRKSVV